MQKLVFIAIAVLGFSITFVASASDIDAPIISQGGASVTVGDVEAALQSMPEDRRAGFMSSDTRANQMLITILRNKQLANQAIEMKLDQDPQVKADIAYQAMIVLSVKRMEAFKKSLTVPPLEAAAKEEYAVHKTEYVIPEHVDVLHILIATKGRTEDDAKALAEKVRAEAIANPADFAILVSKYSDDKSKNDNGGLITNASSPTYVTEFAQAAKALQKENEISPLVRTKFGFHVLKLIKRVPGSQLDFAAVKDKIEAKLKDKYLEDQKQAFLAKFDDSKPSLDEAGMKILQARYPHSADVAPANAAAAPASK